MDIKNLYSRICTQVKKYRFALLILLTGIALLLIPTSREKETVKQEVPITAKNTHEVTSESLGAILSQIKGAGKTEVLLTCLSGERTVYVFDERITTGENGTDQETKAVILSDADRQEDALIEQILAPEYLGAVVVCQGADDPRVALAVSDAVSKATGLGTDRISVCKME